MSDDRTWYGGDPYSEPPADGHRGRRERGGQGGPEWADQDPNGGQPPYPRRPPEQGGPYRGGRDPYRPAPPSGGGRPRDPYEPRDPYDPSYRGRGAQGRPGPQNPQNPQYPQYPQNPPSGARRGPGGPGGGPGGPGGPGPGGDPWRPQSGQPADPWEPDYDQGGRSGRDRARPGRPQGYDQGAGAGGYRSPGGYGADPDGFRRPGGRDDLAGTGGRRGRARSNADGLGATAVDGTINPDLDLNELDPSGKARGAAAGRGRAGKKKRSRGRTIAKWTSISLAAVLVLAGGFAYYAYQSTIGSFKHTALAPSNLQQSALPVDPYGNTAMNILLLGSDTRDSSEDCTLGGDCEGTAAGANADGELVLHVSADRTNATVMSIPRDTLINVPKCSTDSSGNVTITSYYQGQINSALQWGPECQVAAVHDLTGITITGYILFDFSGVVSMSNALGGVPVCVTKAVHDKNSGLQLPAGVSTVQGNTALEFLRTRDSFFDGSDLGREQTTHYFFTQLLQTVRTKMNLSSVTTLFSLGQAAAKSTTVSNNFSGLSNLEGLIESLDKVPNKAITFLTMPWFLDPTNASRVEVSQPSATQMFNNIQNDVSYTNNAAKSSAAPKPPAVPSAPASVDKGNVPVNVVNADGVTGRAGAIADSLVNAGFSQAAADGDGTTAATSEVYYPSGDSADADAVAAALKIPAAQVQQSGQYSKVTVIVGNDFVSGSTYTVVSAGGSTAGAASAPSESFESNADSTGECIPVESGTLQMAHQ